MTDTSWYPENYYIQPEYASYPTINYYDLENFTGRRRKYWNHAWTRALQRWDPVGLTLVFHPMGTYTQAAPHGITAEVYDVPPGIGAWAQYNPPPEDGFIQVDITVWRQAVKGRNIAYLTEVINHEVGHTLGFGHGGMGIMSYDPNKTKYPVAEEIAAAKAYWGT